MMDLATIRAMSRKAAREAARDRKHPLIVEQEDVEDALRALDLGFSPGLSFPFLGDYVPPGWKRTDREPMFVDSSGFGQEGEPAMTIPAFVRALRPGYGYAVIEAGQFQVYVAEYRRI